jgi:hypothetical protein
MNKKLKSWEPTKTLIITIDGKSIEVDSLPQEIKFELETYDRIKADYLDVLFEQEKLHLAMNAKYAQVVSNIKKLFSPQNPETEQTGESK